MSLWWQQSPEIPPKMNFIFSVPLETEAEKKIREDESKRASELTKKNNEEMIRQDREWLEKLLNINVDEFTPDELWDKVHPMLFPEKWVPVEGEAYDTRQRILRAIYGIGYEREGNRKNTIKAKKNRKVKKEHLEAKTD